MTARFGINHADKLAEPLEIKAAIIGMSFQGSSRVNSTRHCEANTDYGEVRFFLTRLALPRLQKLLSELSTNSWGPLREARYSLTYSFSSFAASLTDGFQCRYFSLTMVKTKAVGTGSDKVSCRFSRSSVELYFINRLSEFEIAPVLQPFLARSDSTAMPVLLLHGSRASRLPWCKRDSAAGTLQVTRQTPIQ